MNEFKYLNVGCGPFAENGDGWYNIDSKPRSIEVAQVDATDNEKYWALFKKYNFTHVYFGHVLSQFTYAQAADVLITTRQGLQPGGRIRITDQDYGWFFSTYFEGAGKDAVRIKEQILNAKRDLNDVRPPISFIGPVHQFWFDLHRWGHKSIYTKEEMARLLDIVGFEKIEECAPRISSDTIFKGIEPRVGIPQFSMEAEK